jgi:Protein of unknown function (DUF2846)
MKRFWVAMAGLWMAGSLWGPASAAPKPASVRVPAGTVVRVELADEVSTKVRKTGDTFAIRLSEPLIVKGRIVVPAGATGVGKVIDASKPGMGGKAAKIVLSAQYLTQGRVRIRLQGLQLASAGRGNVGAAQVVGLGGIGFVPLGFAAMAIRGGDVVLPPGTGGMAKLAAGVTLPSLGRASRAAIATSGASSASAAEVAQGSISIPTPPAGQGQVVFFRPKSLLGTGQWFNVREEGKALGKLTNGAYFVQAVTPGLHTYTAKTEPEFNDKLKLQIDPGETYFVEGALTKGVVIGAANLAPSDRAAFNKAAKDLQPAPPPTEDKPGDKTAAR